MIDLFGMFLQSLVGRGFDWALGQILSVETACPRCNQRDELSIGNQEENYIECSNCHRQIQQFTNACDFTINRRSGQIGHGLFDVTGGQKWRWENHGNFFQRNERLVIPFDIRIEGLRGRSVFLETAIRKYDNEEVVTSHRSLLEPSYDSASWNNYWHSFGPENFAIELRRSYFACDARLVSEFHDVLYEDRRIIQPWKF
jgi:hypothetical protein